ncbi:MAG: efflux RND transporter permease subunit [Elusimicrobiota bacterium]|jgi:HAE1 family hydrophobic/amphiphilic exporter-1|nr:efflux RND transporter permease subunit [Elusimicrobiota bacterium]
MNLAKLAIKRPTFIVAILFIVLILGFMSYKTMSVRMFPDIEFPYVLVITQYPGAGPEEIEQLVSKPLEDAISGVSALKHINSVSQDNYSIVYGEFELSKDPDIALQEVKDKVSQARWDLPDDIEEPVIQKLDPDDMPIVTLSLRAMMSSKDLYDFADDVISKEFSRVSGVSKVEVLGGSKREIHVNVDKNKLKEYELTLGAVSTRISANSMNIPAGKIEKGTMDLAFRTIGEFRTINQISNVVVSFLGNDIPVIVKDIGEVEDGLEQETSRARVSVRENGQIKSETSMLIEIYKQSKSNDVQISDGIQKRLKEVNKKFENTDGQPTLSLVSDNARGVRLNLEDVERTIIEGIFLAIIIVYFFLGSWRSTFITSLAIPNSLIGSFVFMHFAGFSLNVMSLMALSLSVGLLIDDAIVVRENIFRHYEEGSSPIKSAITGTNEVSMAVIATTSAVIAVFAPVAFLSGIMGQFFREFGLTVVFAMIISVFDALTIAPMLSAYIIKEHIDDEKPSPKIVRAIVSIFHFLTLVWFEKVYSAAEKLYVKIIAFVVRHKIFTILISIAFFAFSLFIASKLKVTFAPNSEWGEFNIKLEAQPGTSLDQMDEYVKSVEKIIMANPNSETTVSTIGTITGQTHQATIFVRMIPSKERKISTTDMKELLRKEIRKNIGEETLEISVVNNGGMGSGESEFILELFGEDEEVLAQAAKVLMEKCKNVEGLTDIKSNYKSGKPELQIQMDMKKMEELGVNSVTAGNEVRAMIDGALSGKFREHGLEYDIRVQLQEDQKNIMDAFNSTYVNNVNGKLVKLSNVAFPIKAEGPSEINRKDRSVYVTVEGNLAKGGAIGNIQKDVYKIFYSEKNKPENVEAWKNIEIRPSGNAEEMGTMMTSIAIAALLSVVFMFLILASLYESIMTPITIMSALPLAIIGGFVALFLTKQPIDMFTLIGMIMLLGIVAKNSILLVDYIQQKIKAGLSIDEAVIVAGKTRLRPILMTTFAIIAGMIPTALGLSEIGNFRKGMGIVVIGGVISSTLLTLLIVPAIFEYIDKLRRFLRKIVGRPENRLIDMTDVQLIEKGFIEK